VPPADLIKFPDTTTAMPVLNIDQQTTREKVFAISEITHQTAKLFRDLRVYPEMGLLR